MEVSVKRSLAMAAVAATVGCGPRGEAVPGGYASADAGPLSGAPELELAATLPPQCTGPDIHRVERPATLLDPVVGRFSYGYRFKAPTAEGAPVLVYLPGGPGMTSTDTIPTFLPPGWGYLLTDPRGVGCNTLAALPPPAVSSVFFRTSEIAGDVVAAFEDRQLDHYLLYGISYGSILGTVVAHDLESRAVALPIA
jgi:pimeloyl-ACP methyl ester carboxylesterase